MLRGFCGFYPYCFDSDFFGLRLGLFAEFSGCCGGCLLRG